MISKLLVIAILVHFLALASGQSSPVTAYNFTCPESEWKRVEEDVKKCGKDVDKTNLTVCQKIDAMLTRCAEKMEDCLPEEDLRHFKDVMIVATMKFLEGMGRDEAYQDCESVQEFKESNRTIYRATSKCSADEVEEASMASEKCVLDEKINMEANIRRSKPRTKEDVKHIVCDFMEKVFSVCFRKAEHCFTEKEFEYYLARSQNAIDDIFKALKVDFSSDDCNINNGSRSLRTTINLLLVILIGFVIAKSLNF